MEKMTRQGVRDLDIKLGKVKKTRAEDVPVLSCSHKNMTLNNNSYYCPDCGFHWDHSK